MQALHANGSQGFSVFTAVGRVAKADAGFEVSFSSKDVHDEESYRRLVALAGETARIHAIAGTGPPLAVVENEEWSYQWEGAFLKESEGFRASLEKLREAEGVLARELGLRADNALGIQRRARIKALAPRTSNDALEVTAVPDLSPMQLTDRAEALAEDVDALVSAKSEAEASYPLETIRRMGNRHDPVGRRGRHPFPDGGRRGGVRRWGPG